MNRKAFAGILLAAMMLSFLEMPITAAAEDVIPDVPQQVEVSLEPEETSLPEDSAETPVEAPEDPVETPTEVPAETIVPVETAEPAETIVPTETAEPAETTEPAEDPEAAASHEVQEAADWSIGDAYVINGVTVHNGDFSSSTNQCWVYAQNIYGKIWGTDFSSDFGTQDNLLRGLSDSQLTLTPEHLKAYVSQAALGSCLRICNAEYLHGNDGWGHSQIIVQKDENGFTVFQGGLSFAPYRNEQYYTWSSYCSGLGSEYAYIKYIKWPGAPAYEPGMTGDTEITLSQETIPEVLTAGETFPLQGLVSSGVTLSWVTVGVYDAADNLVLGKTVQPGHIRLDIGTLPLYLQGLDPGIYTYRITAANEAGTVTLADRQFTVLATEATLCPGVYRLYSWDDQAGTWDTTQPLGMFRFTYVEDGYYTIENTASGEYLQFYESTDRVSMRFRPRHETDSQLWQILPDGQGYCLVPKRDGTLQLGFDVDKVPVSEATRTDFLFLSVNGSPGWRGSETRWYYFAGAKPLTGWYTADGLWCHFDAFGHMQTGWYSEGGYWYYFKSSGVMARAETLYGFRFDSQGRWIQS